MKKLLLFLISFAAVLAIAVFLSPFLFQILPFKFGRIFNRIVMVGTLICVAVFVRIRKETFIEYGLAWKNESLRLLITAFLAPIFVLSVYVFLQTCFGEAAFSLRDVSAGKWAGRIITAALTGLLVGSIEEFFFRGAIFNGLRRIWSSSTYGLILSIIIMNLFYSILHFVSAAKPFIDNTPDYHDGLKLLAAPFASFLHFGNFWPGFVGLFIFGLMLTGLLLRTKSLYASIGLHAGAVFFIKTDGLWADLGPTNLMWGSSKMYDGFVGWFALGVLYFVLCLLLKKSSAVSHRSAV